MQLMQSTANALESGIRFNIDQNVSLACVTWHCYAAVSDDLRLVAAAYYGAGERVIERRPGLRNPDVARYVSRIRATYLRQLNPQAMRRKYFERGYAMKIWF